MLKRILKDWTDYTQHWDAVPVLLRRRPYSPKALMLFGKWCALLDCGDQLFDLGLPWIPFEAAEYLKSVLKPGMKAFEYGSGGSTRFLARRGCEVNSVEHDAVWGERVKAFLRTSEFRGCNLTVHPPERSEPRRILTEGKPAEIVDFSSTAEEFTGFSFGNYVTSIDRFADGTLDLVYVDGRARVSCIYHSRNKVKPGGWLLVDNSERKEYSKGLELLDTDAWDLREFFGPGPGNSYFWKCNIYFKKTDS